MQGDSPLASAGTSVVFTSSGLTYSSWALLCDQWSGSFFLGLNFLIYKNQCTTSEVLNLESVGSLGNLLSLEITWNIENGCVLVKENSEDNDTPLPRKMKHDRIGWPPGTFLALSILQSHGSLCHQEGLIFASCLAALESLKGKMALPFSFCRCFCPNRKDTGKPQRGTRTRLSSPQVK